MIKVAILIISDKGARGERIDASGKAIKETLNPSVYETAGYEIIPDELEEIQAKLIEYSEKTDIILTSGGTGLSPRDVTPEATLSVIEKEIPGFGEVMRAEGLKYTRNAFLSRATAGIRKQCLIINLPGSPRSVQENLLSVLDAIPHAIEKIKGSEKECAR